LVFGYIFGEFKNFDTEIFSKSEEISWFLVDK